MVKVYCQSLKLKRLESPLFCCCNNLTVFFNATDIRLSGTPNISTIRFFIKLMNLHLNVIGVLVSPVKSLIKLPWYQFWK